MKPLPTEPRIGGDSSKTACLGDGWHPRSCLPVVVEVPNQTCMLLALPVVRYTGPILFLRSSPFWIYAEEDPLMKYRRMALMIYAVLDGERPDQPLLPTPMEDNLFGLVEQCWRAQPKDGPDMADVVQPIMRFETSSKLDIVSYGVFVVYHDLYNLTEHCSVYTVIHLVLGLT